MQRKRKIQVHPTPPTIELQNNWKAFCSKSSLDTFFIVMYNTKDCRTSTKFFSAKEDSKLMLEVQAFISYCVFDNDVSKKAEPQASGIKRQ